jgi:hypothetical protein
MPIMHIYEYLQPDMKVGEINVHSTGRTVIYFQSQRMRKNLLEVMLCQRYHMNDCLSSFITVHYTSYFGEDGMEYGAPRNKIDRLNYNLSHAFPFHPPFLHGQSVWITLMMKLYGSELKEMGENGVNCVITIFIIATLGRNVSRIIR